MYEKYRKDLSRWRGLLLFPLKEDIENLISGKISDFPTNFDEIKEFKRWGKVINFLTPKMSQELFLFIKEWREEITKKQTATELLALQKKIVSTSTKAGLDILLSDIATEERPRVEEENPQNSSFSQSSSSDDETEREDQEENPRYRNTTAGIVITESVAGTAYIESKIGDRTHQQANKIEKRELITGKERKLAEELDPKVMKEAMEQSIESLKQSAKNPRLTPKQVNNINKSIKGFEKALKDIDNEAVDLFNERLKL